jgi:hypothetical protein
MVWDPARITPRSWPEVIAMYRGLEDRNPDFEPMRRLAEHVASKPYAASVFAATSGTALLVAPRTDAIWAKDALRIDIDLGGEIRLAAPGSAPGRAAGVACESAHVVATFEGHLRKAGWA